MFSFLLLLVYFYAIFVFCIVVMTMAHSPTSVLDVHVAQGCHVWLRHEGHDRLVSWDVGNTFFRMRDKYTKAIRGEIRWVARFNLPAMYDTLLALLRIMNGEGITSQQHNFFSIYTGREMDMGEWFCEFGEMTRTSGPMPARPDNQYVRLLRDALPPNGRISPESDITTDIGPEIFDQGDAGAVE